MDPATWEVGPLVRGENYSVGMPAHPSAHPDGWVLELPQAGGSAHYVTTATVALAGKTRVVMSYRVEADPGVAIVPRLYPTSPSMLTLYFQRQGDQWTAATEAWRWYASFVTQSPILPGDYVMVAPLTSNWTAVLASTRENNPSAYSAALAETARVGFVLGGGDGLGHGVYATGPARIVVKSFRLE